MRLAARVAAWAGNDPVRAAIRGVIAAAEIATVAITWSTWQAREHPPLLPLLPLPQADVGWPLVAGILLKLVAPRWGIAVQAAVLLYAVAADQCRIMPQMLSLWWLSFGTLPGSTGGALVARTSLVSLWFFSGLHKLVSPDFFTETAPWLLRSLGLPDDRVTTVAAGCAIGVAEMALAAGALVPRLRAATAVAAGCFHGGVAAALSPLVIGWNPEVVPWNLALAVAAPVLLLADRGGVTAEWRAAAWPARVTAAALLIVPWGYWAGVVDAYLAHCLYSDDVPRAFVCTPLERRDWRHVCRDAGVLVPPAHRLFAPWFLGVGRHGEWLEIEDRRAIARWLGLAPRKIFWADLVPADAEIIVPGP